MTEYWPHLIAIACFALLCGGWVWLQRWIARTEPEVKSPERGGGCSTCSCHGDGECAGEDSREA